MDSTSNFLNALERHREAKAALETHRKTDGEKARVFERKNEVKSSFKALLVELLEEIRAEQEDS